MTGTEAQAEKTQLLLCSISCLSRSLGLVPRQGVLSLGVPGSRP